jgi:putative oxidoreductase
MELIKTLDLRPRLSKETLMWGVEWLLRGWMAYILISNSGVGIWIPLESLGMPEPIYKIIKSMWDTGFMMHSVKAVELICGLALLFNFYVPIALLFLGPVVFNIYGMHIFLFNSYITNGLYMVLICGFLLFRHREKFRSLLVRK